MPNDSSRNDDPVARNLPPSTYDLLTQLTTGPSMREVASTLLRTALRDEFPTLDIEPDLAMVITPRWSIIDDVLQPTEPYVDSLTTVLARQALAPAPVIYIDGEHFLTQHPHAVPAVHLPVKIDAIARLLNELSALIFVAFQEQQLDHWNASNGTAGPRWQILSQSLRKVWNLNKLEGWDEHDCAMARTLFRLPDPTGRQEGDPYPINVYLIDMDVRQNNKTVHAGLADIAVLIGVHEQKQRILTYSLVEGYEKFDSMQQLGDVLPGRLNPYHPELDVQWRLYQPPGNFFDSQAFAMIALQLAVIGAFGLRSHKSFTSKGISDQAVISVVPVIDDLSDHSLSNIRQIHHQLPEWLADASDLDISAYGRGIIDLAQLHTHNQGLQFDDGIASIRDYARAQLRSKIQAHPNGAGLNLDKVEVSIESPVLWGTFVVPGSSDITRHSLVDLALANLTGLPTGTPSVRYNGGDAPDWLTYDYLKQLIEAIDIGKHYPALIKRTLLTDPFESKARQLLYVSHLRVQLPLQALQWKIKGENGLNSLGYRYVAAVVQAQQHDRQVEGQEIVIRRLAFIPALRPGHEQDVVANMFVIGPRDHTQGPCVLYRPLLEPVLFQYPTRQNLLYAIKHSHLLRESVLAWLPESSRFNYEQYVFPDKLPSPWTVARVLVEPEVVLQMSGPIGLSDEVLTGDVLGTLFEANANAMIDLAKQQSVSNTQKRWASYRQAAWQIFGAALPFLGRTAGIAAWIWQIMDDLQETTEQEPGPDGTTSWTAQIDLLLNLGMALVMHVTLRHSSPKKSAEGFALEPEPKLVEEPEKAAPVPRKPIVTKQPDLSEAELPAEHQGPLHIQGALSRTPSSLAATLDRFKISKPEGLGESNKEPGPHLHLHGLAGKWYAQVGERWFEVTVDDNDNVVVVDPRQPSQTGPALMGNLAGKWFVDTRLRLRGAGFRNRRRAARGKAPSRIKELRESLTAFDADERRGQAEVAAVFDAIVREPGPSRDTTHQAFIEKVDARLEQYETPIRQLRALNIIDSVPNYQSSMTDYLNKQLLLTRSAVAESLPEFREKLLWTLEHIETLSALEPKKQAEAAQVMANLNKAMISRLEYAESRYRELEGLGMEGAKVAQTTMRALPGMRLHDLKALQVTLTRYLCIREGDGEAFIDARTQIGEIVEIADLNIQNWVETLIEANVSGLDERIEVLNSVADQFAIVDQRLLDLHAEHPEQVNRETLEDLRKEIDGFNQQAVVELARLLREKKTLEPKPGTSKPPPTPKRKVIKTRFNGVVVGEPRATQSHLVDVKAPMTGRLIATFHEKTPGVWVERESPSPSRAEPHTLDLNAGMRAGQGLLDEEQAVTQRILAHSRKAGCIPVEIEEMLHQYAARLERSGSTIEEGLTRLNLTESDRPSAATLSRNLNDAAQRLYKLGSDTRISMTKEQPPTAARVEWLHEQGLVKIEKVVTRKRLKGPGKNYLDEYEVRDHQSRAALWYAHFHYDSVQAATENFFAGHLKTREQRKLGGAMERAGLSDRDQIAVYRSEISPQLARSLFFHS
ncbi:hypothetical protein C4J93_5303 [Pseudomonas sp. R2-37-08W]|uniref:dermonecrotic toxin domain-containing protein n=1 Tax=Pseudomonas sp. R2-37-08W TaxID=1173273 RepID=UPI000F589CDD|nr:DUF6543 domain-containing protein [Pseudomonas sp. R2-37-08W]AZF13453.1 hypothetical protein C4J93_5303 [Pseudomonas sp. R2-37-08W]